MTRPPTADRRPTLPWLGLLLLWIAALALAAAPFDLPLARAVMERDDPLALWVYHRGTWPSGLLYLLGIFWLVVPSLRERSPLVSWAAAATLVHGLVHPLALTTALKFAFGRLRPHQIGPDGAGFSPFYLPLPGQGGRSFPSGHVASAVMLCPVVLLLWQRRRRGGAVALALLTMVWGVFVAWGRMVHGAHFLSDVLFSLGLAPLLAPLTLGWGARYLARFKAPQEAR